MTDSLDDAAYRAFVQSIIDNIKKHGFPDKKVAFPLEQLYEAAHNRGINFNKVLETLAEIEIAHTKTPEKIIFFAGDSSKPSETGERRGAAESGLDPSLFAGVASEMMEGMTPSRIMDLAKGVIEKMSPGQLEAIRGAIEGMSETDRAALMDKARRLGLL